MGNKLSTSEYDLTRQPDPDQNKKEMREGRWHQYQLIDSWETECGGDSDYGGTGGWLEMRYKYRWVDIHDEVMAEQEAAAERQKQAIESEALAFNRAGEQLFAAGRYNEAEAKYQEAYDKSQVSSNYNQYSSNRDKARTEIDAVNLNSQGDTLFNQGRYSEAKDKYQEAYDKSCVPEQYRKYQDNKTLAQNGLDRAAAQAERERWIEKAIEVAVTTAEIITQVVVGVAEIVGNVAVVAFEGAQYVGGEIYKHRQDIIDGAKYAGGKVIEVAVTTAEIITQVIVAVAEVVGNVAVVAFEGAKYAGGKIARVQTQIHEVIINQLKSQAEFKYAEKVAKEAEAIRLNTEGSEYNDHKEFDKAAKKFKEAYDKCPHGATKDIYKNNWNNAQIEIRARAAFEQGEKLFSEGNYVEAQKKAEQALAKSITKKAEYSVLVNKVKVEVEAKALKDEGDKLFRNGDYVGAQIKYQAAYDKSQVSTERIKYQDNKANSLFAQGIQLHNEGEYKEALIKYDEALSLKNDGIYHVNKAKSFNKLGQYENALSSADRAIVQSANFIDHALSWLGFSKHPDIAAKFEKIEAYLGKAGVEDKEGEYDNALNWLNEALRLDSNNQEVKAQMAEVTNRKVARAQADREVTEEILLQSTIQDSIVTELNAALLQEVTQSSLVVTEDRGLILAIQKSELTLVIQQSLADKLSELDGLWNKAWDTENDEKVDRSAEAQELFDKVLEVSKQALKLDPNSLEIKEYIKKCTSKIEGNNNFNRGYELEDIGNNLLQEAQIFKEKGKFSQAKEKFSQSKEKYLNACEYFEQGNKHDHRFKENLEFVQKQINEVNNSLKEIPSSNITLDINFDIEHQEDYQLDIAGNHNYFEHI